MSPSSLFRFSGAYVINELLSTDAVTFLHSSRLTGKGTSVETRIPESKAKFCSLRKIEFSASNANVTSSGSMCVCATSYQRSFFSQYTSTVFTLVVTLVM